MCRCAPLPRPAASARSSSPNKYRSEQEGEDRGAFRELSAPVTGAVPSVELVLPRGTCVRLYSTIPPAYVGERVRQVA